MGQQIPKIQKIIKLSILLCLLLNSSFLLYGSTPDWFSKLRQIKLLKSTRQEAEKLIGNPKINDSYDSGGEKVVEYKVGKDEITAVYSGGKCSETNQEGFDVDKDTIIELSIYLKEPADISGLNLNLRGFDRGEIHDLPGIFEYRSENLGERYIIEEFSKDGSKKVKHFEYFPSNEQKKFSCNSLDK